MLAQYLEAEWGDFLPYFTSDADGGLHSAGARSITFYKRMAQILAEYVPQRASFIDVGGGTGRLCFELSELRPDLDVALFDSSELFTSFARAMASGRTPLDRIPIIDGSPAGVGYANDVSSLSEIASRFKASGVRVMESKPQSAECFDVVACCNVLDRVDDQSALIDWLVELVSDGGVLAVAAPFDYLTESPQKVTELAQISPPGSKVLFKDDLDYVIRSSPRKILHYKSSLLVLRL
jgi:2-polyprenyl-3-methyl-5-hydroxy-6-metoxy-1,4-benzoquinol methylase